MYDRPIQRNIYRTIYDIQGTEGVESSRRKTVFYFSPFLEVIKILWPQNVGTILCEEKSSNWEIDLFFKIEMCINIKKWMST